MNRPRAPDMDKKTGVYQLKHVASGKVYIGSAVCLWRRRKDHTTRLNCGRHGNEYLQRAWIKYGPDAFEWTVLEYCSKEDRLKREQHWIDTLNATNEARLKAMWQDPEFRAARLKGLEVGRNKTNAKRRKQSVMI